MLPWLRAGARRGIPLGLACVVLVAASNSLQSAAAEGDTRTLSFRNLHTQETITVTFKRDGRYDDAALKKLDWFMRDWRREEAVKMDPHLFDVLWEAYREVGGRSPIEVICGYRAPGTNAMLRARSTGVAQNSNHTTGHAIDFAIPGVDLEKLREVGLRLQRGGVGFYPTSGSPFVHMDTGTVRHWPRMTRDQLVKVFPNGRTVHVPSDGQPLPGYALALADVERRGGEPSSVSLAAARDAGIVTASTDGGNTGAKPKRSFLASLFGGNLDTDQLSDEEQQAAPAPKRARTPVLLASAAPVAAPKPVSIERVVPLPAARPMALAQATPAVAVASIPPAALWNSKIESSELEALIGAKPVNAQPPFALASVDPATTASTAPLAYAAADTPLPKPALRARPMGTATAAVAMPKPPMVPSPITVTTFAVPFTPAVTGGFQNPGSPWLRATMLTPSVSSFLSSAATTAPHMRPLAALLHKPAQSLVMAFSDDPHHGMTTDRFDGSHAVVFLATATFTTQMTASLR
ncbi:MAG: DUF882 domain-containing protein [Pseudolabrys sp.]|nr:DUF882 domain-containing protein [Pseudolabrys sp.]MDP2297905.1 DUF882 domain-containing protein [Pseudolabrys sp.]